MFAKFAIPVTILFAFVPVSGHSATSTSTFQVQMNVQASCVAGSATDLNFGNTGVIASAVDLTSTITVQCTNSTPYNVGLNKGLHGASVSSRQMSGTGGLINYSLFRDASRTQNWGDTIGLDTLTATGTGASQSHTVYGRVPAQSTPAPAFYTDTITVTITY